MNDSSSEQINFNELKFSREKGFFDTSLSIRYAIGVLFTVSLFLILHFREIHVEILEPNSIAPAYVVSQIDFDFHDEEATIILKQEAVRDVGKIYQIDDKEIRQQHVEFEHFLVDNPDWRKEVNNAAFEHVYEAIDRVQKILIDVRFTDPRTLQKLREAGIPSPNYLIYSPTGVSESVILPPYLWQSMEALIDSDEGTSKDTLNYIFSWFQSKLWRIQEDISAQSLLSRKLKSRVPDKYTHVRAGSRIIDQNDRITTRQVAMLQTMQKALREKSNLWHPATAIGSLLMALIFAGLCISFFRSNYPQVMASNRKLMLLVTIVILVFCIAKFTEILLLVPKSNLISSVHYPLFVPLAAILVCSLLNPSVATFVSGFLTLILTISLVFEKQGFMVANLIASLVAVLSTRTLKQRKEVFVVSAKAWLCCLLTIISLNFYQSSYWGVSLAADIFSITVSMLLTSILVVGLLPLFESAFKAMTDVSLMEYMDPNSKLLRRLSIEAPGTYQHSIVVGNLAESAAIKIGANGLFCRVATLYHDIGKIVTPQYFTENQQNGVNVHQLLTPMESAKAIIAHVAEGEILARKAGLPEQFIDIIREHHGTTLTYYFYRKEVDRQGGDKTLVDEKDFRYAGPKPRSKESAIIMISDSLEAASRSLDEINEASLTEFATHLIRAKEEDGQFDNCLLTFEELTLVKETLVKTLVAYSHSRVKYPHHQLKNQDNDRHEG
ncbi:MAG: HDIG domain-containing protein [Parachlamydiaceae bacterium]|nr:HDIG domain-containing protein [Parachlamydiaceae bacterium]